MDIVVSLKVGHPAANLGGSMQMFDLVAAGCLYLQCYV